MLATSRRYGVDAPFSDANKRNGDKVEKTQPNTIGFLTALGDVRTGVVGGFLALNAVGRPVEFHCTAPVRPNRAQEILYGATLEGFLYGEQIAPALIGRTKLSLAVVLTNLPSMLTAASLVGVPLGLVFQHCSADESGDSETSETSRYPVWNNSEKERNVDAVDQAKDRQTPFYSSLESAPFIPGVDYSTWREAVIGRNLLALPVDFTAETTGKIAFDECVARIEPFFRSIDSVEPFERIRLAVEEAQRAS